MRRAGKAWMLLAGLLAGCGVEPVEDTPSSPVATKVQRQAGTLWVQDLDTRPAGFPRPEDYTGGVTLASGESLFLASDELHGNELWASNGTATGTRLVKELDPGLPSFSPGSARLTQVGSAVYFTTNRGIGEAVLWKTDGTAAGTVAVKGFPLSFDDLRLRDITPVGSAVYFLHGDALWRTDGTPAGTVLVRRLLGGENDRGEGMELCAGGGTLFFPSLDAMNGVELWKLDTAGNPVLVKDLTPGTYGGNPRQLTWVADTLFFIAGSSGRQLWKSDGTEAGTQLVVELGGPISELAAVGGTLYFTQDRSLWKSDGTPAGTVALRTFDGGFSTWERVLTPWNGTLFFTAVEAGSGKELWRSDGTPGSTVPVADLWLGPESSNPGELVPWGSHLYFASSVAPGTLGLWKSDGTPQGTEALKTWEQTPSMARND